MSVSANAPQTFDVKKYLDTDLGKIGKMALKTATVKDLLIVEAAKKPLDRFGCQLKLLFEGKGWISDDSIKSIDKNSLNEVNEHLGFNENLKKIFKDLFPSEVDTIYTGSIIVKTEAEGIYEDKLHTQNKDLSPVRDLVGKQLKLLITATNDLSASMNNLNINSIFNTIKSNDSVPFNMDFPDGSSLVMYKENDTVIFQDRADYENTEKRGKTGLECKWKENGEIIIDFKSKNIDQLQFLENCNKLAESIPKRNLKVAKDLTQKIKSNESFQKEEGIFRESPNAIKKQTYANEKDPDKKNEILNGDNILLGFLVKNAIGNITPFHTKTKLEVVDKLNVSVTKVNGKDKYSVENKKENIKAAKEIINKLSPEQKEIFKDLLIALKNTTIKQKIAQPDKEMNAENLGLAFAPQIFQRTFNDPATAMKASDQDAARLEFMINNVDEIFELDVVEFDINKDIVDTAINKMIMKDGIYDKNNTLAVNSQFIEFTKSFKIKLNLVGSNIKAYTPKEIEDFALEAIKKNSRIDVLVKVIKNFDDKIKEINNQPVTESNKDLLDQLKKNKADKEEDLKNIKSNELKELAIFLNGQEEYIGDDTETVIKNAIIRAGKRYLSEQSTGNAV